MNPACGSGVWFDVVFAGLALLFAAVAAALAMTLARRPRPDPWLAPAPGWTIKRRSYLFRVAIFAPCVVAAVIVGWWFPQWGLGFWGVGALTGWACGFIAFSEVQ